MEYRYRPWPAAGLMLVALIAAGVYNGGTAQETAFEENQAMNATRAHETGCCTSDEAAIAAIPKQMEDAWNRGSGEEFATPFTEGADFIAFEGTHLKGRRAIAEFHQQIFDLEVNGARLVGAEPKFVRLLSPEHAVMHATVRVVLAGQQEPSPSRDSMQLFVLRKRDAEWRVDAVLNARQLTLERQFFFDAFDSLPSDAQRQVTQLVTSLQEQHRAAKDR
jgi:uncharacterized protein (TIGR02246 family)